MMLISSKKNNYTFLLNERRNNAILMMYNMNPNISAPLGFTIPGIERVNKNS